VQNPISWRGNLIKALWGSHPNYILGFVAWCLAIVSIICLPKLISKATPCLQCDEYADFVRSLSGTQADKLVMLEAGAILLNNKFFLIGDISKDEYRLYEKQLIVYKLLEPIIDEKVRRYIILNSIVKSLPPAERDLIGNRKAVIIYRNDEFVLVGDKNELKRISQ
jgi:hypothetical protein